MVPYSTWVSLHSKVMHSQPSYQTNSLYILYTRYYRILFSIFHRIRLPSNKNLCPLKLGIILFISCCYVPLMFISWVSYQIRKIAGCACAGISGKASPATDWLAIPTCITAPAWCTCRNACRWRGKRPSHSRRMSDPQLHISDKRPMISDPLLINVYQHILSRHIMHSQCVTAIVQAVKCLIIIVTFTVLYHLLRCSCV